MKSEIIDKVTEIVERAGRKSGIEAVEVELKGAGNSRILRIFIDKPEGVTHADCQHISEYVGTVLDVEDVIPEGRYTLEVSSPGVERKLSRPRDFERFTGQNAKLVLTAPVGDRKVWEGKLAGFSDGIITLEPAQGEPVKIPLDQVARANLKFNW
ncbi:MAG TPA: ribosome maturation factor RimP [Bryobacteraceae bacterium]|jgi:ribosome maturation factor RimP|nr:ribosome maturation factor RimP [Bryobacteraceae bacterium]